MEFTNSESNDKEAADIATKLLDDIFSTPPSLDIAINKAAKHLPKGFIVNIKIEHEGYCVELEGAGGSCSNVDGGDGIISDINEAICIANGFNG